jgi:hypothetical protein
MSDSLPVDQASDDPHDYAWIDRFVNKNIAKWPPIANQRQRRIMTTRGVWEAMFDRPPVKCIISQRVNFITSEKLSNEAIVKMFNKKNACNYRYLFGFDGEFINDRSTSCYRDWAPKDKFVLRGEPTHYDYDGPFSRFIQICTISGQTFIWDLKHFPKPPTALHELITEKGHGRHSFFIHDVHGDSLSYFRMYFPRTVDFHTYMPQNLSVPICFEMSKFVDTKMLYEVKDRKFKS